MERLALAVILALSVWALARIIRRSLPASGQHRGACSGCPLASGCDSTGGTTEHDAGRSQIDSALAESDGGDA